MRDRLALFISGSGTTMQAIIKECKSGRLKNLIEPAVVIASGNCTGVKKAKALSLPTYVIGRANFPASPDGGESYGQIILSILKKLKIDLITQNGWLPLTPKNIIKAYQNRIFNQHPGPLDPPFLDFGGKGMYGLRVHGAILNFQKLTKRIFPTEATVQLVAKKFDRGEILLRQEVPVYDHDTPQLLAKRVLPYEHELQIKLLELFAARKLKVWQRQKRLIKNSEIPLLKQAKEKAIHDFPEG